MKNNLVKRGAGVVGLLCFFAGLSTLIGHGSDSSYYAGDMPTWLLTVLFGLQWVWLVVSFLTLCAFVAGWNGTKEISFASSAIWTFIFVSVFIDALTGPYITVTMPVATMLKGCLLMFVVPGIIGIDAFEDYYN